MLFGCCESKLAYDSPDSLADTADIHRKINLYDKKALKG